MQRRTCPKWEASREERHAGQPKGCWQKFIWHVPDGKKGGQRDEGDLELARQYAADVCDNSGLELLPNYEDLFKYRFNNNEESLLAMQWVPLGEWGVQNTLIAELAFNSEVVGGLAGWSSLRGQH